MESTMRPSSADDVLDLMDVSFHSAALGAALELGLFWLLDEQPLARSRCHRSSRSLSSDVTIGSSFSVRSG